MNTFQQAFAQALRHNTTDTANDLTMAALLSQPAFAVYRNTVLKGCIDALQANYSTVARLVGSEWFRSVAALVVASAPPQDSCLLHYGQGFADFLANFEPAAELPYLPGVARLDRFWTEAHTAADAAPLAAATVAALAPEQLAELPLRAHPAARWIWFTDMPVYTIWQRNRDRTADDSDIARQAEGALLTRPADDVVWCPLNPAGMAFLDACAQGSTLGEAAGAALAAEPQADLSALLAQLLRMGALTTPKRCERPLRKTAVKAIPTLPATCGLWQSCANTLTRLVSHDLLAAASRLAVAAIFFYSGRTKVEGFLTITEGTYELFRSEYALPLIPPGIAAHLFPLLLLLGMTLTIQIFVYPDAWPTHLSWATLMLYLVGRGGGRWSLDQSLFHFS